MKNDWLQERTSRARTILLLVWLALMLLSAGILLFRYLAGPSISVQNQPTVVDQARTVSIKKISDNSRYPIWDSYGNLYYINLEKMALYKYVTGHDEPAQVAQLPVNPTLLDYSKNAETLLVYDSTEESCELVKILLDGSDQEQITPCGIPKWISKDNSFIILSKDVDQATSALWRGNEKNTSVKPFDGTAALDNYSTYDFSVNDTGEWIAFQLNDHLEVWRFDNNQGQYIFSKFNASNSFWNPGKLTRLFFENANGELCWSKPENNWVETCFDQSVSGPYQFSPDGEYLIFFSTSSVTGKTVLWKIGIENGNKILLLNDLVGMGEIKTLSISPTGEKIAIINQYEDLILLTLGK